MKKFLTINIIIICYINISCKQKNESSAVKDVISAPSAIDAYDINEYEGMGKDLPPEGRSTFDLLTMEQVNGQWVQNIPYPFPSLIEYLSKKIGGEAENVTINGKTYIGLNKFNSAMFPKGRSLQRNTSALPHDSSLVKTANDFFAYPRLVLGAKSLPAKSPYQSGSNSYTMEIDPSFKLYIGIAEPSRELEVISYNPILARFEFQLVRDYAPNKTPDVRYAHRGVCLSCHQNLAPIFPKEPWSDSNVEKSVEISNTSNLIPIHELIAKMRQQVEKSSLMPPQYLGFPIKQQTSNMLELDNGIDMVNNLIPAQAMWTMGCESDAESGKKCRAAAFTLAFYNQAFATDSEDTNLKDYYKKLKLDYAKESSKAWKKSFSQNIKSNTENISGKIAYRTSNICNHDNFSTPDDGSNKGVVLGGGVASVACSGDAKFSPPNPQIYGLDNINNVKFEEIFAHFKADYALAATLDPLSPRGTVDDEVEIAAHYGESRPPMELVDHIRNSYLTVDDLQAIFDKAAGNSPTEKMQTIYNAALQTKGFENNPFNRFTIVKNILEKFNTQVQLPPTIEQLTQLPKIKLNLENSSPAPTTEVERSRIDGLIFAYCSKCHFGDSSIARMQFVDQNKIKEGKFDTVLHTMKASMLYRLNFEDDQRIYSAIDGWNKNKTKIRSAQMPARKLLLKDVYSFRFVREDLAAFKDKLDKRQGLGMITVQDLMSSKPSVCSKNYIVNLGAKEDCLAVRPILANHRLEIVNHLLKLSQKDKLNQFEGEGVPPGDIPAQPVTPVFEKMGLGFVATKDGVVIDLKNSEKESIWKEFGFSDGDLITLINGKKTTVSLINQYFEEDLTDLELQILRQSINKTYNVKFKNNRQWPNILKSCSPKYLDYCKVEWK